jgi:hypothetical protein
MYKEKMLKCISRYIGKCASRLFASLSAATKGDLESVYRAVETL